uniref:Nematode cuticle collagen N-terminal domain-containing protein n=1 Tax=Ditylenchus dipsaci TaxID=166011 RepID=A0A915CW78_9BILA
MEHSHQKIHLSTDVLLETFKFLLKNDLRKCQKVAPQWNHIQKTLFAAIKCLKRQQCPEDYRRFQKSIRELLLNDEVVNRTKLIEDFAIVDDSLFLFDLISEGIKDFRASKEIGRTHVFMAMKILYCLSSRELLNQLKKGFKKAYKAELRKHYKMLCSTLHEMTEYDDVHIAVRHFIKQLEKFAQHDFSRIKKIQELWDRVPQQMDEQNRRNVLILQAEKTKKVAYCSILLGAVSLSFAVLAIPMLFLRAQYLLSTVQEEGFFCHSRSRLIFRELERNGAHLSDATDNNQSAFRSRHIRSSGGGGSYALPNTGAYAPAARRGGPINRGTTSGGRETVTTFGGAASDDGEPGVDGQPGLNGEHGSPSPEPSPANIDWCQDCPQAPAGPPGSAGLKGEHGTNGKHGLVGRNGNPGPPGEQGSPGPAGPQGEPGLKGPPGKAGELVDVPGPPGPMGIPGVAGGVGALGHPGSQGRPGPAGIPGVPGVSGPPGARGNPGLNGLNGAKGQPGAEGGCDHCALPRTQPGYLMV